MQDSLQMIEKSQIALLGSVDDQGFPNIKAMLKMKNEGLREFWFSTNTSSKRVSQFKTNPKASVYFLDQPTWKGLMLTGTVSILNDRKSRELVWRNGFEKYYPLGIDDPDYCVLKFTAHQGNFYHNLENLTFEP
ncbi:MAG: pyridoxamine 5'-phosphate oxidase family protein [Candidatus Wallbacteria bacterium]|nr:pyridoxamine 5'-phosphate oxidase family protein [Candidatus Wallbacteria bacterium]